MSNEIKCTVKWYNSKKGYGFLSRDDSDEKDIFCHASALREANIKFLNEGDKTKITMRFRGRELAHKEIGLNLLKRVESDLNEIAGVEQEPVSEGRQLVMLLSPLKKKN